MGLVELLSESRAAILAEWAERVQALPSASLLRPAELHDHLPALFDQLVRSLGTGAATPADSPEPDLASLHVLDRFTQGFDARQLAEELSLLRDVLFTRLIASGAQIGLPELRRLDQLIDRVMVRTVTIFSQSRERTFAALERISDAIVQFDIPGGFLQGLLTSLKEASPSIDFIAILLHENGQLRTWAEAGLEGRPWKGRQQQAGIGFAGQIVALREARELRAGEFQNEAERDTLERTGARVLFGVPLIHEGAVVGVAKIGSRRADRLSSEDKLLLRALASRLTAFIVRARLAESHRQSEELLQAVLDSATAVIFVKDANGRYLKVNRQFEQVFQRGRSELLGRTSSDLLKPEDARSVVENDQRVLSTGQPLEVEEDVTYPHGRRTLLTLKFPLHDANGKPYAVAGISTDITERKREERERRELLERERLARSEAERVRTLLDTFLNSAPVGFAYYDPQLRYLLINPTLAAIHGVSVEEHLGRTVQEVSPKLARIVAPLLQRVLDTGQPIVGQMVREEIPPGSGRRPALLANIFPIRGPDGKLFGIGAVVADITERVRLLEEVDAARAQAEQSLAQLDAIFASAPVGFAFLDRELRYVRLNQTLADVHQRSIDAHLGHTFREVVPDARPEVEAAYRRIMETGEPVIGREFSRVSPRAPGFRRHWMVNDYPVRTADGRIIGIGSAVTEITDQKRAEEQAAFLSRATEALSSSLDYQTTLGKVAGLVVPQLADWCLVHVWDEETSVIRCLAVAHRDPLLRQEVLGMIEHYPLHPDAPGPISQVLREGRPQFEAEVVDAELSPEVVRREEHWRLYRRMGLKSALFQPLIARGRALGVITFAMAESGRQFAPADRTLAEELVRRAALAVDNARLYQQAQQAIRIREDFLSMASHDLRSPLSALILQLHLLQHQVQAAQGEPQRERVLHALTDLDRGVTRISEMLDTLLDVSRIHAGRLSLHLETVNLCDVAQHVLATSAEMLRSAHCTWTLNAPASVVGSWDRLRLEQVMTNLLSNAAKYGTGKPVEISIWEAGERGYLRVRDHGVGIPPEQQAKLFQRFERVGDRTAFKGTGLGLWIVRNIVEAMGGAITVESTPGQGASFTVALPRGGNATK